MLTAPLNDKECLEFLHAAADRLRSLPEVQEFAQQFDSLPELEEWSRSRDSRLDFGDPDDGPRLPCEVSQRARFLSEDPNCFENTLDYLTLAPLIDPTQKLSSASVILNQGWHTFPVNVTGFPEPVILDPGPPPRNTMLFAATSAKRIAPTANRNLPHWFRSVTKNIAADEQLDSAYEYAMDDLRNAVLRARHPEAADFLIGLGHEGAQLWGTQGARAVYMVERSIRNISGHGVWSRLARTGKAIAPQVIRAALIAELGPIGEIAYQHIPFTKLPKKKRTQDVRDSKNHQRLRRMSLIPFTRPTKRS